MPDDDKPTCFGKHWDPKSTDCIGGLDPAYTDPVTGSHIAPKCSFHDICKSRVLLSRTGVQPTPTIIPIDRLKQAQPQQPLPPQYRQPQTPQPLYYPTQNTYQQQRVPVQPPVQPMQPGPAQATDLQRLTEALGWYSQMMAQQQRATYATPTTVPAQPPMAPPVFATPTIGQVEGMNFRTAPMLTIPEPADGGSYVLRFAVEGGRAGLKGMFDQWGTFLNMNPILKPRKSNQ